MADVFNLADRAAIKRANDAPDMKLPRELWIVLAPKPNMKNQIELEPLYGNENRTAALEYANDHATTYPDAGPYTVRRYVLSE